MCAPKSKLMNLNSTGGDMLRPGEWGKAANRNHNLFRGHIVRLCARGSAAIM